MPKKCHMSLFVLFADLDLHLVQQDTILYIPTFGEGVTLGCAANFEHLTNKMRCKLRTLDKQVYAQQT